MLRTAIGGFIGVLVGAAVIGGALAATGRISVYVNGHPVEAQAVVRDGVTYLPVRAVAEALGLSVQWDAASRSVYVQSGGTRAAAAPTPATRPAAGDTVHITRTGQKYHRAGCRYLNGTRSRSDIPISRKDAEARGYTPCSVCNP